MILAPLGIIAVISGLCVLATTFGYLLWRKLRLPYGENFAFVTGASFFVGITSFATAFALLQWIFGAQAAFVMLVCIFSVISISQFPWRTFWYSYSKQLFLLSIGCAVFFVLNFMFALVPLPLTVLDPATVHYSYGIGSVVHSFRAENIAVSMVTENALPFINQNSGQAVLAGLPHLIGLNMPQFSLLVWHTLVLVLVSLLAWGVSRLFLSPRLALIPTAMVLVGNTALSYRYISTTDTGHALLRAQNIETVIGLATLFLAVLLFRQLLREENPDDVLKLGVLGMFVLSWSLFGAHLSLVVIPIMMLYFLLYKQYQKTWKVTAASIGVVIFCTIFSAFTMGGMFAFHAPESSVPGVKTVASEDKPMIEFRAFRTVEAEFHTTLKMIYLGKALRGDTHEAIPATVPDVLVQPAVEYDPTLTIASVEKPNFYTAIFIAINKLKESESVWNLIRFLRSIQLMALPLVGLLMGYWLLRRRSAIVPTWFQELYLLTLPLFIGGWILSSIIFFYGQYGELSRFFAPGITASMFLLGIILAALLKEKKGLQRSVAIAIIFVATVPVILDFFVVGIVGNFVLPSTDFMRYESLGVGVPSTYDEKLNYQERLELLFSPGTIRGKDV